MSPSKSRGYVKVVAILASLVITTVVFRSAVLLSGANELPDPNIFPIIGF
jgi:hypothetical protein